MSITDASDRFTALPDDQTLDWDFRPPCLPR
jgi:hypothetical protein